jgi:hypothetical protein
MKWNLNKNQFLGELHLKYFIFCKNQICYLYFEWERNIEDIFEWIYMNLKDNKLYEIIHEQMWITLLINEIKRWHVNIFNQNIQKKTKVKNGKFFKKWIQR